MKIKTVIFDLDGTITKPFFDFDSIRKEIGMDANGGPILEAMENMTDSQRLRTQAILKKHEDKAVRESTLNNGAREAIDGLRKNSISIGILTRNTKNNAIAIAKKHNLKFDTIIDRNDGPVKPDAFGVLKLCDMLGSMPKETLVVGDYLFDLLSAKAAGAIPVLIKNHDKADEFQEHAEYVITALDEILKIIEDINRDVVNSGECNA
jgi:HAD superfamily hydrolase (TIGR01509 family)